ncbi:MAG: FtsX-like permease family protein [Polyangiaceae bacterium]
MNLVSVGARNLLRNKFRTALTIVGGAVAIVAFIMLRTVISAWNVAADYAAKDRIATRHKVSIILPIPKTYYDQMKEVPGVSQVTYANWFGAKNPKNPDDFFANMAVEPASFLQVYDEVSLPPDQKAKWFEDRRGAIVGDVLAQKLGVKVGDTITLTGTIYPGDWQFNVSGIYTATRKSFDRSEFLFHWAYLNESLPARQKDKIGWMIARVNDPSKGADVSVAVDRMFDEKDTQTTTMSERAMSLSFLAGFSAILRAIDAVSFIIMFIMMMILGNTIAMGVRERTREYGVLRALGFSPGHIRVFILGEAAFLSVIAGILGTIVAFPIVELGMGRFLEENMGGWFPYFRIETVTMVSALVLACVLGLVASVIPAIGAARLSVTDALRRIA